MKKIAQWFHDLLHRPYRVFWICTAVVVTSLIVDGTLFQLWSLSRDHSRIQRKMMQSRERATELEYQIHEAQQPEYIERQARDQFDLVREGDLVFVFSDDQPSAKDAAPEK